jgi:2-iminobutanoate/2-iminopropanoate deaminase
MNRRRALIGVLALGGLTAVASGNVAAPQRRYIEPHLALGDGSQPPYSAAVMVGDTVYLSGAIGLTPDDKVPPDAGSEARLLLDSFERRLAAAGMSMDDLVSVTVYSSDVQDVTVFNAEYRKHFHREFPARAYVGVGKLLYGARWEMQGLAVRRR